ncbi:MAG: FKBP-type peptidyl-prolyl cis-trans isomerase [Clostridia bacterium]|nr:FKBP-type peptidyl-prolyl cis-trans isomerase [Clostridia bacterium]
MLKTKIFAAFLCAIFVLSSFAGCSDGSTADSYKYDLTNYSYSAGLDSNGFFEGIKATDFVTLPEYKGVTLPASVLVADQTEVQAQLDEITAQYDTYSQVTDKAVANGDTVNIDYVGSVDGVEFEGGSTGGMGTDVTIGVTQYIDDFLEQLIGHMPGEKFDIEVTFPENYGQDHLNGKDAIFNITINYIQGDLIKAELTDDIASEYGFATVADLTADIEKWLVEQQKSDFFTELMYQSELKGEMPKAVLDFVICADLINYQNYASMFGVTIEDFIVTYVGAESYDNYIETNMEFYQQSALYCLATQALAELEGINASDMAVSDAGLSDYVESYGMPYLKQYVLQTIVAPAFVIDNSVAE